MPFLAWKRKPLVFGRRSDILRVRRGRLHALEQTLTRLIYGELSKACEQRRDEISRELIEIEKEIISTKVSIQGILAEVREQVFLLLPKCGRASSRSKDPQIAFWE